MFTYCTLLLECGWDAIGKLYIHTSDMKRLLYDMIEMVGSRGQIRWPCYLQIGSARLLLSSYHEFDRLLYWQASARCFMRILLLSLGRRAGAFFSIALLLLDTQCMII